MLRRVLLKVTILALLLLIFYCYQTSNGVRWIIPNFRARNASLEKFTTTIVVASYSAQVNSSLTANVSPRNRKNYYNIWCIFTKVDRNSPMKRKFQIFADSLLRLSSVDIAFHVISDDDSQNIAKDVIHDVMLATGKFMEVYILF